MSTAEQTSRMQFLNATVLGLRKSTPGNSNPPSASVPRRSLLAQRFVRAPLLPPASPPLPRPRLSEQAGHGRLRPPLHRPPPTAKRCCDSTPRLSRVLLPVSRTTVRSRRSAFHVVQMSLTRRVSAACRGCNERQTAMLSSNPSIERPSQRPLCPLRRRPMSNVRPLVTVRAARPDEHGLLSEIAYASKARWSYSAEQLGVWQPDLVFTATSIASGRPMWHWDRRGEPVGVVQLNPIATPWVIEGLWVLPSEVGRGVGTALLRKVLVTADQAGQSELGIDADPMPKASMCRMALGEWGSNRLQSTVSLIVSVRSSGWQPVPADPSIERRSRRPLRARCASAHVERQTPMHALAWRAASVAAIALTAFPVAGIESQALGIVEPLAAQVRQVFACGEWSESGVGGYYRIVLADVGYGSGTEIYIQRVRAADGTSLGLKIVDTTPVRELNNDHAQYQVRSAKCTGAGARSSVELIATFEHDEGDLEHRIRIALKAPGRYPVTNTGSQASAQAIDCT